MGQPWMSVVVPAYNEEKVIGGTVEALRVMFDADCESSLASIPKMVSMIETGAADVVAGSREAKGADVGRTQPIPRRIASWNFIRLCKLIMHEPLRDIFCGFKLFRAKAAEDAFSRQ